MIRQCPRCRSVNVRRSLLHVSDVTLQHIFFSPYRCRDCRTRFWALSRNAYYAAGAAAVVMFAAAIAWGVSAVWDDPPPESEAATIGVGSFAETAKQAERNDPQAEYRLAQMYAHGVEVRKDDKSARTWLERAAEHGSPEAQYEFGVALRDGRGVIQDFERAAKWLQRAAASGNANAQLELGRMYLAGTGVPADNAKAYMWLNLAAAGGIERAVPSRDAALRALSPAQVAEAQAEARRLTDTWTKAKPTGK
jgi:TPR repeat protein